jgi:hypothetical protein
MMRFCRTPILWFAGLSLLLGACSGGNNTSEDGGDYCGTQICTKSEQCIGDALCVPESTQEAQACVEQHDNIFQIDGPADLSCHNTEPCSQDTDCPTDHSGAQMVCTGGFCGIGTPGGGGLPETVTFRGCVDAFGLSDITNGIHVALYRTNQDPTGTSQWDVITTEETQNCTNHGAFEIADVPTNTPLILKTYDDLNNFVITYKYNLILWADLATDEGGGNWVFDTRESMSDPRTGQTISLDPWRGYAILTSTYNVILMAVGITLPADHGAIAGTIRDCSYKELVNVRCGANEKPEVITYFTNAEDPRPDHSRDSSNMNGIYAAISLPEGTHQLSCLARDSSGNQVPLGTYQVKVFPQAITILSMDWYPGAQ